MQAGSLLEQFKLIDYLPTGLVAFIMDSIGGVIFAKNLEPLPQGQDQPNDGAAGISAFPRQAV